jgi:hypothetical protein
MRGPWILARETDIANTDPEEFHTYNNPAGFFLRQELPGELGFSYFYEYRFEVAATPVPNARVAMPPKSPSAPCMCTACER